MGLRRALGPLAIAILAAILLALPWMRWQRAHFGSWGIYPSFAKQRLVYAIQRGLVDPVPLLNRLGRDVPANFDSDPGLITFWELVRAAGVRQSEAIAADTLSAARAANPEGFAREQATALATAVGWPAHGVVREVASWIPDRFAPDTRLARGIAAGQRFIVSCPAVAPSASARLLERAASSYTAVARPVIGAFGVGALLLFWVPAIRERLAERWLALAALAVGYLASVLLHGWSFAGSQRFVAGFDWVAVLLAAACAAALVGPAAPDQRTIAR
jgi:hypothetical protein